MNRDPTIEQLGQLDRDLDALAARVQKLEERHPRDPIKTPESSNDFLRRRLRTVEAERDRAWLELNAHRTELAQALEPVCAWFDGDGQPEPPKTPLQIVRDTVEELVSERALTQQLRRELTDAQQALLVEREDVNAFSAAHRNGYGYPCNEKRPCDRCVKVAARRQPGAEVRAAAGRIVMAAVTTQMNEKIDEAAHQYHCWDRRMVDRVRDLYGQHPITLTLLTDLAREIDGRRASEDLGRFAREAREAAAARAEAANPKVTGVYHCGICGARAPVQHDEIPTLTDTDGERRTAACPACIRKRHDPDPPAAVKTTETQAAEALHQIAGLFDHGNVAPSVVVESVRRLWGSKDEQHRVLTDGLTRQADLLREVTADMHTAREELTAALELNEQQAHVIKMVRKALQAPEGAGLVEFALDVRNRLPAAAPTAPRHSYVCACCGVRVEFERGETLTLADATAGRLLDVCTDCFRLRRRPTPRGTL